MWSEGNDLKFDRDKSIDWRTPSILGRHLIKGSPRTEKGIKSIKCLDRMKINNLRNNVICKKIYMKIDFEVNFKQI